MTGQSKLGLPPAGAVSSRFDESSSWEDSTMNKGTFVVAFAFLTLGLPVHSSAVGMIKFLAMLTRWM